MPANKCYNCRVARPSSPALIDERYDQVSAGSGKRVGISVDLAQVGTLVAPDPMERYKGGEIMEAFNIRPAQAGGARSEPDTRSAAVPAPTPASVPAAAPSAAREAMPAPPPIRPPRERSIAEVGGMHWTEQLETARSRTRQPYAPAPSADPCPAPALPMQGASELARNQEPVAASPPNVELPSSMPPGVGSSSGPAAYPVPRPGLPPALVSASSAAVPTPHDASLRPPPSGWPSPGSIPPRTSANQPPPLYGAPTPPNQE